MPVDLIAKYVPAEVLLSLTRAVHGRKGGSAKNAKKASASRENGKKYGGRPRKVATQ